MTDRDSITRRQLLRGKFLAGLLNAAADRVGVDIEDTSRNDPPRRPGADPPMVMRYPKDQTDIAKSNASPRFRRGIPVLRPPGAIDEPTFLAECTRCDACVEACPHDAITHAPPQFREAAGTPMIDPDRAPCRMCDDFPCIAACEPDVLSFAVAKSMGVARITEQTCLAHQGTTCTVCSEHCPVEGAIEIEHGKPRVVETECTGCGVCRYVCPAPENAVLLMPTFVRPSNSMKVNDN